MKNPADLTEVCETILAYYENGDPIKDVIEQSAYSTDELIHELALFYLSGDDVGGIWDVSSAEEITAAIKAWEDCKASDAQLATAIDATDIAIVVLRAYGAGWIATMGLQSSSQSMHSEMHHRVQHRRTSQLPSDQCGGE